MPFISHMSPADFRAGLAQLKMGTEKFTDMTGTNRRTVQRWQAGAEGTEIPGWVPVFLAMLTVPGARDMAVRVSRVYRGLPIKITQED